MDGEDEVIYHFFTCKVIKAYTLIQSNFMFISTRARSIALGTGFDFLTLTLNESKGSSPFPGRRKKTLRERKILPLIKLRFDINLLKAENACLSYGIVPLEGRCVLSHTPNPKSFYQ